MSKVQKKKLYYNINPLSLPYKISNGLLPPLLPQGNNSNRPQKGNFPPIIAMMQDVYFIADLHLTEDAPKRDKAFIAFCHRIKNSKPYLYILGDLFDAWLGDDMMGVREKKIAAAIMMIREGMGRVFFQAGNRDFLIGNDFIALSGCQVINEEAIVEHNSMRIFLTHGDILCTADRKLQKTREETKTLTWRKKFLTKPPAERLKLSKTYQLLSSQHQQKSDKKKLKISNIALKKRLKENECNCLIHGHTHSPKESVLEIHKQPRTVISLGDWTKKAWFAHLENKEGAKVELKSFSFRQLKSE